MHSACDFSQALSNLRSHKRCNIATLIQQYIKCIIPALIGRLPRYPTPTKLCTWWYQNLVLARVDGSWTMCLVHMISAWIQQAMNCTQSQGLHCHHICERSIVEVLLTIRWNIPEIRSLDEGKNWQSLGLCQEVSVSISILLWEYERMERLPGCILSTRQYTRQCAQCKELVLEATNSREWNTCHEI